MEYYLTAMNIITIFIRKNFKNQLSTCLAQKPSMLSDNLITNLLYFCLVFSGDKCCVATVLDKSIQTACLSSVSDPSGFAWNFTGSFRVVHDFHLYL